MARWRRECILTFIVDVPHFDANSPLRHGYQAARRLCEGHTIHRSLRYSIAVRFDVTDMSKSFLRGIDQLLVNPLCAYYSPLGCD